MGNQPGPGDDPYDANGTHFGLNDWLETKRIQASANGTVEETCLSLPFGDSLSCSGTDATEHHFTGKERDAESGSDNFGKRYYASSMGRWMSRVAGHAVLFAYNQQNQDSAIETFGPNCGGSTGNPCRK